MHVLISCKLPWEESDVPYGVVSSGKGAHPWVIEGFQGVHPTGSCSGHTWVNPTQK